MKRSETGRLGCLILAVVLIEAVFILIDYVVRGETLGGAVCGSLIFLSALLFFHFWSQSGRDRNSS